MSDRTKLEDLLTAAGVGYTVAYDGPAEECPLDGGDDPAPPSACPAPRPSEAPHGPVGERNPPPGHIPTQRPPTGPTEAATGRRRGRSPRAGGPPGTPPR